MSRIKRSVCVVMMICLACLSCPAGAQAEEKEMRSLNLYSGMVISDAVIEAQKLAHFYSTNRDIANVTKDGKIMTFSEGECVITDGKGDSVKVVVEDRPSNYKKIALTFDDGPGKYSDELMDFFAERGVHVTFFMIGSNVPYFEKQVKRMYEEGHELGNHSYNHPQLNTLTAAQIRSEMKKTDDAIFKAAGVHPTVMRPPYGATNATVLANVGYPAILWNIDTLDWKYRNADYVADQVYKGAASGNIILVHEIHKTTVDGVKVAVDKLLAEGWKFVTVTDLLTCDGSTISAGNRYSQKKTLIDGSDKKK